MPRSDTSTSGQARAFGLRVAFAAGLLSAFAWFQACGVSDVKQASGATAQGAGGAPTTSTTGSPTGDGTTTTSPTSTGAGGGMATGAGGGTTGVGGSTG